MSLPNRSDALLLDYPRRLVPHQWPDGDGFTQEEVLREYAALAAQRLVPDEATLNRLHPELAAELAQFFVARTAQQVAETVQAAETEGGVQAFVHPEQAKG